MEKTLPPSLTSVFDNNLPSYSPDLEQLQEAHVDFFQSALNIKKSF
jgi:hypothetical protein